jgi:hypothetical protein
VTVRISIAVALALTVSAKADAPKNAENAMALRSPARTIAPPGRERPARERRLWIAMPMPMPGSKWAKGSCEGAKTPKDHGSLTLT